MYVCKDDIDSNIHQNQERNSTINDFLTRYMYENQDIQISVTMV